MSHPKQKACSVRMEQLLGPLQEQKNLPTRPLFSPQSPKDITNCHSISLPEAVALASLYLCTLLQASRRFWRASPAETSIKNHGLHVKLGCHLSHCMSLQYTSIYFKTFPKIAPESTTFLLGPLASKVATVPQHVFRMCQDRA